MISSLVIALVVSVTINILTFWYMRRVLPRFIYTSENLKDLTDVITAYRNHLKQVYSMELFYGDETIKFLMSHTISLLEILEEFEDEGTISVIQQEVVEENKILEEKGEDIYAPPPPEEENVFYAGSRRRGN